MIMQATWASFCRVFGLCFSQPLFSGNSHTPEFREDGVRSQFCVSFSVSLPLALPAVGWNVEVESTRASRRSKGIRVRGLGSEGFMGFEGLGV